MAGRSTRSLEGIEEPVAERTSPSGTGFGAYVAGVALVVLGVAITIPVIVNFPDSWPGAVVAVVIIAIGAGLIHTSAKARNEPSSPE